MASGADADSMTRNLLAVEAVLEMLHDAAEQPEDPADADLGHVTLYYEWHDALIRLRELDRAHHEGGLVGTLGERYAQLRRLMERASPRARALGLEPVPPRLTSAA